MLRELGWDILMHPPYISDLAPSDYNLFLFMRNDFTGKIKSSQEKHVKSTVVVFVNSDCMDIIKLPSIW